MVLPLVCRDLAACLLPFDWPWWLREGQDSDEILQWWIIWGDSFKLELNHADGIIAYAIL
jgi:hypothetical protein